MSAITPPTTDTFAQRSIPAASPARNAIAVTPSDTADLTQAAKSLYIGVTGDVTVLMMNATDTTQTVLFKAVPVGMLPVQVRRVMATGTTASDIVALYA